MADVRPIRALHYDPERVEIGDVTAPPYDVIDAAGRERLVERSADNVVELDLPRAEGDADPYEHAAELLEAWRDDEGGVLDQDAHRTIWALEQDYTDPDGNARTRRGFLARIGVTEYGPGLVRPHERTQPGPKEDRLRLTRATRHNLSPIFVLHAGDAWSRLSPALAERALLRGDRRRRHRPPRLADRRRRRPRGARRAARELRAPDRRRPPPLRDRPHLHGGGRRPRPLRRPPLHPRLPRLTRRPRPLASSRPTACSTTSTPPSASPSATRCSTSSTSRRSRRPTWSPTAATPRSPSATWTPTT